MIRILIVSELGYLQKALHQRLTLESDLEVVGQARDIFTALELSEQLRPDLVLLDAELPNQQALTFLVLQRELGLGGQLLVLSSYPNLYELRQENLRFVPKQNVSLLLAAIRQRGVLAPVGVS